MIKWYSIITCLIISHQIIASSIDRVNNGLPENSHRTRRPLNLDPGLPVKDEVDDALKWVSNLINKDSTNTTNEKPKKKLNLDPFNFDIQDRGLTPTPAEETAVVSCTTENGEAGACVLYYLCDETNTVISDGSHLLDLRFGDGKSRFPCGHYLESCCKTSHLISTKQNVTEQPTNNRPFKTNQFDVESSTSLPILKPEPTTATSECGWNNPALFIWKQEKKEMANYSDFGEFPWMVAIMNKSDTDVWVQGNYLGGGSLIHPQVVITAYHVLRNVIAEQIKCRAGEWDTQTDNERYKHQERNALKIVQHKDFYLTSLYNDIALIFLESQFDLAAAPHIGTACLSPLMEKPMKPCFGMGWGKRLDKKIYVNVLKKVKLPLVDAATCQNQLRKTRLRELFQLHVSLTCAGGEEGIDICKGDGGSALVCPTDDSNNRTRYAMVGMAAYGMGCGKKDVPGVYVNIPHLRNWVDQQMAAEGYDTSTYSF